MRHSGHTQELHHREGSGGYGAIGDGIERSKSDLTNSAQSKYYVDDTDEDSEPRPGRGIDLPSYLNLDDFFVQEGTYDDNYYNSQARNERHWLTQPALIRRNFRYYIPLLMWAPRYSLWSFPSDVIAGLAVSAIVIPQSLALALLAELPPEYGLYASWLGCLIYFVLGRNRHRWSGRVYQGA
eukprot:TRINITY_DN4415_c0_g1_i3.p1 TRINITY_DN4415_c0_g1~~TRINITY_DN4415_c0_g1_i3.p1  ORF type:complete len:182 (+),score=29.00 TRINITY_DN4415_c0_g1_i3:70-615(+)